jgi:hypothetical protein
VRGYLDIADKPMGFVTSGSDINGVGLSDGATVSLGDSGTAILDFIDPIYNGPGYDFEKDSCNWSDLSLTASTAVKGLNINYNSTFWLYNNSRLSVPIMKNMDVRLTTGTLSAKGHFWGGDLLSLDSLDHDDQAHSHSIDNSTNAQTWQVSLSPSYQFSLIRSNPTELFTPTKNYGLSASANLNFSKNWSMRWNGNYSFNDDQWTQNSFTFGCDLECWEMHFEWRPERLNPGYYFKINIKKLPEIKWEQKQ